MNVLIIAGGPLLSAEKILNKIGNYEYDFILCADSGYDNASKLEMTPNLIIGDMDSIKADTTFIKKIIAPSKKDESDLFLCVLEAVKLKAKNIDIICATGGRLDHTLANISILEFLGNQTINGRIFDEQNIINWLDSENSYKNTSKYISIIPISKKITFSTTNLIYKTNFLTVKRSEIISISNECISEEFTISLHKGKALLIQSDD